MRAIIALYLVLAADASATTALPASEIDIAGPSPQRKLDVPLELSADRSEYNSDADSRGIEVFLEKNGQLQPVEGLSLNIPSDCNESTTVQASLSQGRYSVTKGSTAYFVRALVPCTGVSRLIYQHDSPAGKALGIWRVARIAEKKLEAEVGLLFWKRRVTFVYPADGDYYSNDTVRITEGHHWDVVSHELGHALYAQAGLGVSGGGSHAIDRCYTNALALSEGWATYFAGWLHLDPTDTDPKFEYLVPRRAPIALEHIPVDVCAGPTNEWRMAGFFWDLFDKNADGEDANETFARSFQALQGRVATGAESAALLLARAGVPLEKINSAWTRSFLTPR